mmetsp:Transcript_1105/g.2033  ORF Transcript_1105/g.2033 Transcript_1105/m.2033 type:complete len:118 (+) Transcript_1105:1694-2047(+)
MLTIYFVATNRVLLASLTITLSLSIKAGALLLIPAVLGWTQYHLGTKSTILAITIIFAVQLLLLSPFICEPIAIGLGFPNGAETKLRDYLEMSQLLGGDTTKRGACYDYTLYWRIVG